MPVQEGFVTILVTEETRRWLRLLAAVEDKPIYTIVSALVAEAVHDSPVCALANTALHPAPSQEGAAYHAD